MKRAIFFLMMLVSIVMGNTNENIASQRWHDWRKAQDKFPLAAWAYFMRFDGTYEEYKTYADANFTFVAIPQSLYHYNNATKAGLDVLIGGWQDLHLNPDILEQLLTFPSEYPDNVMGYLLKDEPEPSVFKGLANVHKTVYEKDKRNVIIITDMLPGWAWMKNTRRAERFEMNYDELIAYWIKTANPPVILNCHYSPMLDGSDREDMYADKELMRKHALKNNIGNMSFISAAEYRDWYRYPSESDFNWQVYTCLAYGSQGIWYWNWRIQPKQGEFFEGLVTYKDGTPTNGYEYVKAINAEVQDIGSLLMKLRSRNVWHTGEVVPRGTTRFVPMPDSGSSVIYDFVGDDFIIGEFDDQDNPGDKDTYIMLVNKRHAAGKLSSDPSLKAQAIFKPADYYGFIYQYKKSNEPVLLEPFNYNDKSGYYKLDFDGGKGAMLRFSRKPLTVFTPIKNNLRLEFARTIPAIDGIANDAIWQRSQPLELNIPLDSATAGNMLKEKGSAKAIWKDTNLWITAEFQDSDVIALGDADGQEHYKLGDCLEIFIKPEFSQWYWEIWINPKGNYTTVFWDKKDQRGSYTFEMKTACRKTDTGWSVEVEIPFAAILQYGRLFKQGQWTLLIARQNYNGKVDIETRELSSYPQLSKSNFHLVDEYARLNLALY